MPHYGYADDASQLSSVACLRCAPAVRQLTRHPRYKQWCDEYFYLRHRAEPRGIGGIFFDDLNAPDFATCFGLQQSVGEHFLDAYVPILARRTGIPYGERERDWQAYRRGRYVEFNLVWDRGTLFGLQSGGRTESILMSLPPVVTWRYDWKPAPGSAEAALAANSSSGRTGSRRPAIDRAGDRRFRQLPCAAWPARPYEGLLLPNQRPRNALMPSSMRWPIDEGACRMAGRAALRRVWVTACVR